MPTSLAPSPMARSRASDFSLTAITMLAFWLGMSRQAITEVADRAYCGRGPRALVFFSMSSPACSAVPSMMRTCFLSALRMYCDSVWAFFSFSMTVFPQMPRSPSSSSSWEATKAPLVTLATNMSLSTSPLAQAMFSHVSTLSPERIQILMFALMSMPMLSKAPTCILSSTAVPPSRTMFLSINAATSSSAASRSSGDALCAA
mmetsp:Transcript_100892/g.174248  ORF Transcript_100892/g.174248 Transcript_100892/m.174248 type:complete len:203 (-) Transcript_100892:2286-2894(-)